VVFGLRTNLINSVPTNDQILVPETLLKKRKSQEKARAERTDAIQKQKAVSTTLPSPLAYDGKHTHQLDTLDAVDS
jgi:hypothetical protein